MTTLRQPCGGASSISYRKRTRSQEPPTPTQRPDAPPRPHATSGDPYRTRRRLTRSARAAETSPPDPVATPEMRFGGLPPNP
jgi:hypothetical protein